MRTYRRPTLPGGGSKRCKIALLFLSLRRCAEEEGGEGGIEKNRRQDKNKKEEKETCPFDGMANATARNGEKTRGNGKKRMKREKRRPCLAFAVSFLTCIVAKPKRTAPGTLHGKGGRRSRCQVRGSVAKTAIGQDQPSYPSLSLSSYAPFSSPAQARAQAQAEAEAGSGHPARLAR